MSGPPSEKVVHVAGAGVPARVRITAMPPEIAAYFEALRRYAVTDGRAALEGTDGV
jgi:hypothetical protein